MLAFITLELWETIENTLRFPDGRLCKLKSRLCARGDRQVEGVD